MRARSGWFGLLAEDWGRVLRARSSPLAFSVQAPRKDGSRGLRHRCMKLEIVVRFYFRDRAMF